MISNKDKSYYIRKAENLSKELKESQEYIDLLEKKEKFDNDKEIKNLNLDFEINKNVLNEEMSKEKPDPDMIKNIGNKLRAIYSKIHQNKLKIEYEEAEKLYNNLVNDIYEILNKEHKKDFPSSKCNSFCSDCSGCF